MNPEKHFRSPSIPSQPAANDTERPYAMIDDSYVLGPIDPSAETAQPEAEGPTADEMMYLLTHKPGSDT